MKSFVRQWIIAIIVFVFIYAAWYGGEMLIHHQSQKSVIDIVVAILISLHIAGAIEKGVVENERKREIAEKFAKGFNEYFKKGTETKDGEDESGDNK